MKFYVCACFCLLLLTCKNNKSHIPYSQLKDDPQVRGIFQQGEVYVDNQFAGARMNGFQKLDSNHYRITILPENKPINKSPWYSFKIWSDSQKTIQLELDYIEFQHRYTPKLSKDGKEWRSIDRIKVDSANFKASWELNLSKDTLWVSAQEVIDSKANEVWVDRLAKKPFITKEIIGKSSLGRDLYAIEIIHAMDNPSILILGRQHPPEIPGGTFAMQAFVEELIQDNPLSNSFRKRFNVLAIPLVNPDGVDLGYWRHNAKGIDLNRDWKAFSQIETQVAQKYVHSKAENSPIKFGIDFHTSFSGPYLLVADSTRYPTYPKYTASWIAKFQSARPKDILDVRPRSQELPYAYNWMINDLKAEAVTYEEGDEEDRIIIKERAQVFAQTLMQTLLE